MQCALSGQDISGAIPRSQDPDPKGHFSLSSTRSMEIYDVLGSKFQVRGGRPQRTHVILVEGDACRPIAGQIYDRWNHTEVYINGPWASGKGLYFLAKAKVPISSADALSDVRIWLRENVYY